MCTEYISPYLIRYTVTHEKKTCATMRTYVLYFHRDLSAYMLDTAYVLCKCNSAIGAHS